MKIAAIMAGSMDGSKESGAIGDVIAERGCELEWFYRLGGDLLPSRADGHEALIVFGGEVSVHDSALKTYFDELAMLIRDFHSAGKAVLGSCLGSQAIAYAFGARVMPQGFLEYGFTSLERTPESDSDPLLSGLEARPTLFELHSDTFELPDGAILLMTGEKVLHQAYRIGDRTYGFQCHFEVTPEIVTTWTERELVDSPSHDPSTVAAFYTQAMEDFQRYQTSQVSFARAVVNRWLDLIPNPQPLSPQQGGIEL